MAVGGERGVGGIAGNVGLVDLQAVAGQAGHLLRQHAGDRHQQRLEIAVVIIQQSARQHVGAGDGELEGSAGHGRGEFAIGEQVERAFAERLFYHARGLAAELHGALAGEALVIAAPHLGAYAGHGAEEIFDHPVGIGVIDVEAIEFAVGGQIDAAPGAACRRRRVWRRGAPARWAARAASPERDSCPPWW